MASALFNWLVPFFLYISGLTSGYSQTHCRQLQPRYKWWRPWPISAWCRETFNQTCFTKWTLRSQVPHSTFIYGFVKILAVKSAYSYCRTFLFLFFFLFFAVTLFKKWMLLEMSTTVFVHFLVSPRGGATYVPKLWLNVITVMIIQGQNIHLFVWYYYYYYDDFNAISKCNNTKLKRHRVEREKTAKKIVMKVIWVMFV